MCNYIITDKTYYLMGGLYTVAHAQFEAMAATDLTYRWNGESSDRASCLPDIALLDRLGVVLRDPFDGIGQPRLSSPASPRFMMSIAQQPTDFYA